jgi:hypothetical protein
MLYDVYLLGHLCDFLPGHDTWRLACVDSSHADILLHTIVRFRMMMVLVELYITDRCTQPAPWLAHAWLERQKARVRHNEHLGTGSLVQARDFLGGWCPARIVAEQRGIELSGAQGWLLLTDATLTDRHRRRFQVAFLGWSTQWNEWVTEDDIAALDFGSAPVKYWVLVPGYRSQWDVVLNGVRPPRWFPCTDVTVKILRARDFTRPLVCGML